jgi:hypothetical protein
MRHEKVIYTRSWFAGLGRHFLRDVGRSAAFGLILLIGFVFLIGIPLIVSGTEWGGLYPSSDLSSDNYPGGAIIILLLLGIPMFVICCWGALEVADDRHWEKNEPSVWDDNEASWFTSTVAFSRFLEQRGSHINSALVRYDNPRLAAHRMIDKIDERTLQLYLSLLSAVQLEKERVQVESVDVTPKKLDGDVPRD